jgi:hypothetical protein
MNVYQQFHDLPFTTLDPEVYAVLSKLVSKLRAKTDIIKVNNEELDTLFKGKKPIGRDKIDKYINELVAGKYITRDQKRNPQGQFDYNEIKIITNLVE